MFSEQCQPSKVITEARRITLVHTKFLYIILVYLSSSPRSFNVRGLGLYTSLSAVTAGGFNQILILTGCTIGNFRSDIPLGDLEDISNSTCQLDVSLSKSSQSSIPKIMIITSLWTKCLQSYLTPLSHTLILSIRESIGPKKQIQYLIPLPFRNKYSLGLTHPYFWSRLFQRLPTIFSTSIFVSIDLTLNRSTINIYLDHINK
jgi:hypothetical protein